MKLIVEVRLAVTGEFFVFLFFCFVLLLLLFFCFCFFVLIDSKGKIFKTDQKKFLVLLINGEPVSATIAPFW